jgi:histidinol phosphatase-like PHP family hydrolase
MDMHNHTRWSDGYQTVEELIEYALSNGVTHLGITDHYETSKCPSLAPVRIPDYINEIRSVGEKFKGQVQLYAGIEVNVRTDETDLNKLNFKTLNKLDYVLFEYVNQRKYSLTLDQLSTYTHKLSIPCGLAHTSLDLLTKKYADEGGIERVLEQMRNNNLFWEINVNNGYRYSRSILGTNAENEDYRNMIAEKLKEHQIRVSIGTDCHTKINDYIENRRKAHEIVKRLGIKPFPVEFVF